jgi:hypothetical protein
LGAYHNGQVPDTFRSQGSMQAGWNLWLQGRTRTSSPVMKSSVQIEHPNSAVSAAGSALPSPASVCAFASGLISATSDVSRALGCISPSAAAPVTSTAWSTLEVPSANSMSLSPVLAGSGSPNLTIGSVSSMALASPFARLCLARPVTAARGPYLSGFL